MADLDDDLPAAVWTGLPMVGGGCGCGGEPVMGEDGWVVPVHYSRPGVKCPGSMAPVTAMQTPKAMDERIEQHVVQAMPPRINDDWDTP